jgi:hypothetical protein
MDMERAEQATEAFVVLGRQDLVAECEHMIGVERVANFSLLLRRNRLRQINAADLGADDGRQRIDHDSARVEPLFVGFESGSGAMGSPCFTGGNLTPARIGKTSAENRPHLRHRCSSAVATCSVTEYVATAVSGQGLQADPRTPISRTSRDHGVEPFHLLQLGA